ncbi:MAG: fumarate reductase/succinate dehydrogenase flavoprotein subunit, partial [Chlorobium sp.]|nr:fumarate reductase/succinate dehydrogenase flavoprotein subunit [Chlorobium sp.]
REYGGLLANRSFGGAQVSRTFYARGQTGQQLLLGAYGALNRQIAAGTVTLFNRRDVLDTVLVEGKARGIIARNLVTGEIERHGAHAVVMASGGYGNVFYLSTNAMGSNVTPVWSAYRKGAMMANPSFTQIHPTCIPVHGDFQSKLTLMSESLRNDGRIWVPAYKKDVERLRKGEIKPSEIAESDRDYYLERRYPAFGNLVPRDVASRAAKERCDAGYGVGRTGVAVYLDFADSIKRKGRDTIEALYGNLFDMYRQIVAEDPYETPMMIYPAVHYTMGGLWVDYELMTTVSGLYAIGECNFSDHGANRLGASALMQGLADGYFILPSTISRYLADEIHTPRIDTSSSEFTLAAEAVGDRLKKLLNTKGTQSVENFHRRLGKIMWEYCGMSRSEEGLAKALELLAALKEEYRTDMRVPGGLDEFNPELEKAWRVADFIELGELMVRDALQRRESCGGHFREEYQTPEGEALRNDDEFAFVALWESLMGSDQPAMHKEPLEFLDIKLSQRSYK